MFKLLQAFSVIVLFSLPIQANDTYFAEEELGARPASPRTSTTDNEDPDSDSENAFLGLQHNGIAEVHRTGIHGAITNIFPHCSILLDVVRGDGLVDEVGTFRLEKQNIPYAHSLTISNLDGSVTAISDYFLNWCSGLTHLKLSLSNVRTIGDGFLNGCKGLTHLGFSLGNVTMVSSQFLGRCRRLRQFELSLGNVRTIGDGFLYDCKSLTHLILSLSKVTTIGDDFLLNCGSLTKLELSLGNVRTIGNYFLSNCGSLRQLKLSLGNVTTVGNGFLCDCKSLTHLMLSLSNVTTIGNYFLSNCGSLRQLKLSLDNVRTIGNGFLWDCGSLTELELSLGNVRTIGNGFLCGCESLTRVVVSENPPDILVEELVQFLRNSNIPKQQKLWPPLMWKFGKNLIVKFMKGKFNALGSRLKPMILRQYMRNLECKGNVPPELELFVRNCLREYDIPKRWDFGEKLARKLMSGNFNPYDAPSKPEDIRINGTVVPNELEYCKLLGGDEVGEDFDPEESPMTMGEVRRLLELVYIL